MLRCPCLNACEGFRRLGKNLFFYDFRSLPKVVFCHRDVILSFETDNWIISAGGTHVKTRSDIGPIFWDCLSNQVPQSIDTGNEVGNSHVTTKPTTSDAFVTGHRVTTKPTSLSSMRTENPRKGRRNQRIRLRVGKQTFSRPTKPTNSITCTNGILARANETNEFGCDYE